MPARLLRLAPALLLAAGLLPSAVQAQWRLFLPRSFDHGATLDLFGSSERDEVTGAPRETFWQDDFLKAKVTLFSEGYFYHPRFLVYRASVAGAMKRELFEDSSLPSGSWHQASGLEYDTQVTLLPEHAYNLMLFARRVQPMARERSATLLEAIDTSYGALLRYRKRPIFGSAGYTDDTIDTGAYSTRIQKLDLAGQYYRDLRSGALLSFNANLTPTRFSNNRGFQGDSTDASLGNVLAKNGYTLSSNVSHSSFDQKAGGADSFGSRQFHWLEQLTADLKHGLRARAEYRFNRGETRSPDAGGERRLTSRSNEVEAALLHQLFQSLESTYTFRYRAQDSTAGQYDLLSHELGENYAKRVPGGRLMLNAAFSTSRSENRGRTDVISEGHQAVPVPGTFRLVQSNVDRRTLVVYARSPLPPNEAVQLTENIHYAVAEIGGTLEIRVVSLPAQFAVPGSFTFEVSYSLLTGRFTLQTDALTHSATLDLFRSRFVPYYTYVKTRSRVLEGVVPGFLPDSVSRTVGIRSVVGPVRGRVQYQDVEWDGSPFTVWDGELQYLGPIGRNGTLSASATYTRRDIERTTESHGGRAFREEIESASASYQQQFFSRSLTLSAGGGYTRIRGLVDTRGTTWNGSLAWNVGKLSLSAGASSYLSESVGAELLTPRRLHRYYYLRVTRQLF